MLLIKIDESTSAEIIKPYDAFSSPLHELLANLVPRYATKKI
jgi:hypothetical protein